MTVPTEKMKQWDEEQVSLIQRAVLPLCESFSAGCGCSSTPETSVPTIHCRQVSSVEFDTTFCHDCFVLPTDAILSVADHYRHTDPLFTVQLERDVARQMALIQSAHSELPSLSYVGGMDISFVPNSDEGIVSLVVLSYPELSRVRVFTQACRLTEEYMVGYLAFREAPHLQRLWEESLPEMRLVGCVPQLLIVDGCGTHHVRRAGLALHIGVSLDIPTIGCAKNMLMVDGVTAEEVIHAVQQKQAQCHRRTERNGTCTSPTKSLLMGQIPVGPLYPIVGHHTLPSPVLYGYAAMTSASAKKCIFISPGNRIGYAMSVALVLTMCRHRIPEPTRLADLDSRELIRQMRPRTESSSFSTSWKHYH